ncbi:LPXTG cell wall anchor domain-containing protein [Streptomyces showdoensis]|uniref:LPXTG-domain-containing protein cell wall anchor domain protein n=1 Tax=Streptomyces showdoensis TaxID=68268 RepID=A0A2P2GSF5_STREW|nr:LPXTG cell wall anchor domain-containing protein [Streptomyces showdoensis]KKZ74427.1 LPXTG-domain-containing protein cell wall anchor domain protein [Streptomyces showdoensis]
MRRSLIPAGALVAALAGSLVLAPGAFASGKPHGDNGTVKIHDSKTDEELKQNEPKVCSFYLDAFGFDAGQKVQWHIEAWANNDQDKGTTVKDGTIVLDGDGHERTADMTLPNGQYKLFWNFEGENGRAKHKVFKTDCEPDEENPGEPTPSGTPSGTPSETPSETPSGTPSGTPSETPSGTPSGTPGTGTETPGTSESPSASATTPGATASTGTDAGSTGGTNGTEGDLAQTGSSAPIGVLAAVAAVLAGAGAFLVSRRRKAQQH